MKSKIFITGAAGFIGFQSAKKFLEKGIKVHGFDCINNYYDIKLKKTRLEILKKYKNFTFTKANLENEKKLSDCIIKFKPQILSTSDNHKYQDAVQNVDVTAAVPTLELLPVYHLVISSKCKDCGEHRT